MTAVVWARCEAIVAIARSTASRAAWMPTRDRPLNESLEGQRNPTGSFWDFGSVVPGGLPYQPWAAELYAKRKADQSKDNPDVKCMPLGILQMNTHPFQRRFVQAPGYL